MCGATHLFDGVSRSPRRNYRYEVCSLTVTNRASSSGFESLLRSLFHASTLWTILQVRLILHLLPLGKIELCDINSSFLIIQLLSYSVKNCTILYYEIRLVSAWNVLASGNAEHMTIF